jgi:hypothetical protein
MNLSDIIEEQESLFDECQAIADEFELWYDSEPLMQDSRETLEEFNERYAEWEAEKPTDTFSEEDAERLKYLESVIDEIEDYSSDGKYTSLIPADDFMDYVIDLVEDDMGEIPSYVVVDWEQTARDIQMDYSSVDFDGVTYWFLSN